MKLIRFVLGKIILTLNALFKPTAQVREASEQRKLDEQTKNWRLYELNACPFCVKVRRELIRLSLHIPLKDVGTDKTAFDELMRGGKKDQVPCLMIPQTGGGEVRWIYESSEIIAFLRTLEGQKI